MLMEINWINDKTHGKRKYVQSNGATNGVISLKIENMVMV